MVLELSNIARLIKARIVECQEAYWSTLDISDPVLDEDANLRVEYTMELAYKVNGGLEVKTVFMGYMIIDYGTSPKLTIAKQGMNCEPGSRGLLHNSPFTYEATAAYNQQIVMYASRIAEQLM